MLATMPSGLLNEWMAFDALEPLDSGQRAEAGAAINAAILANVHRDGRKRPYPYEAAEFMPQWGRKREEPTPEDVWKKIRGWASRKDGGE